MTLQKFNVKDIEAGNVPGTGRNVESTNKVIAYLNKSLKVGEACFLNEAIRESGVTLEKKTRQSTVGAIKRAVNNSNGYTVKSVNRKTLVERTAPTSK